MVKKCHRIELHKQKTHNPIPHADTALLIRLTQGCEKILVIPSRIESLVLYIINTQDDL